MAKSRTVVAPEASEGKRKYTIKEGPGKAEVSNLFPDKDNSNALETYELRKKFIDIGSSVAISNDYLRNWVVDGLKAQTTPGALPEWYTIDKYYPNAKTHKGVSRPLFVDEPRDPHAVDRSYAKQKRMLALGLKMIVVEQDTTLDMALDQIGEFI